MPSVITLLLQAALSLLLMVQSSPNIDPVLRTQAITVANQAIQVASTHAQMPSTPPSTTASTGKAPVINSAVSTSFGPFGTGKNIILGNHLTNTKSVYLRARVSSDAASNIDDSKVPLEYTVVSNGQLNVVVPNSIIEATYDVYIENPDGTSKPFPVGMVGNNIAGVPTITFTLHASSGNFGIGTNKVFGSNFTGTKSVYLQTGDAAANGATRKVPLTFTVVNDTRIDVVMPDSVARASYRLYIENAAGTNHGFFLGMHGSASLTMVTPTSGQSFAAGNSISFSWMQSYSAGDVTVSLKNISTGKEHFSDKISSPQSTLVHTGTIPASETTGAPAGEYQLTICDADRPEVCVTSAPFTITSTKTAPVITAATSNSGTSFNIGDNYATGSNFTGTESVYLQSTTYDAAGTATGNKKISLTYTVENDTKIKIVVPDSITRDSYNLYIKSPFGASQPFSVGTFGK